jgi:hypothetical protein
MRSPRCACTRCSSRRRGPNRPLYVARRSRSLGNRDEHRPGPRSSARARRTTHRNRGARPVRRGDASACVMAAYRHAAQRNGEACLRCGARLWRRDFPRCRWPRDRAALIARSANRSIGARRRRRSDRASLVKDAVRRGDSLAGDCGQDRFARGLEQARIAMLLGIGKKGADRADTRVRRRRAGPNPREDPAPGRQAVCASIFLQHNARDSPRRQRRVTHACRRRADRSSAPAPQRRPQRRACWPPHDRLRQ